MNGKRLYKSRDNRMISGVCAGIAEYFGIDPTLVRLAWVVFSVLLWGRNRLGWRGHKAIRWTLAGFCLLMLAYFGSKLVREYILHI